MGVVVVHGTAGEPVVLRDALVLVWDALSHVGQTSAQVVSAVSASASGEVLVEDVDRALEALREAGVVEEGP